MRQRKLGNQGLEVGEIGLGTMGMTMAYGPGGDEESHIATIHRAHELGVTMFDTAELYGYGTGSNEQILGRGVQGFREEIVIATKFGFDLSDPSFAGRDSRPEHIKEVADDSLRYLGTDYIDVFYQHRVDPDVPIEEVAGAVAELVEAGKVRYFGLSEPGPETIRRAHAVHPVSVLQTEYSVFERDVEAAVLPVLGELGVGFVAYAPLGRGFLTGDFKPAAEYDESDFRRRADGRYRLGNYEKNAARDRATRRVGRGEGGQRLAAGDRLDSRPTARRRPDPRHPQGRAGRGERRRGRRRAERGRPPAHPRRPARRRLRLPLRGGRRARLEVTVAAFIIRRISTSTEWKRQDERLFPSPARAGLAFPETGRVGR
jgi:aryl-alcohol dehydrogenase-like predicted oxidoreductase